jgi:hypothetical protein
MVVVLLDASKRWRVALSSALQLLYLHGLHGSPQSDKAVLMQGYLQHHPHHQWHCPQLTLSPTRNAESLAAWAEHYRDQSVGIVGSSMGGFYATWLSEQFGFPCVLVNPVVAPLEKLSQVDLQLSVDDRNWLAQQTPKQLKRPENYWVLLQTGDEVLDYHQATAFYRDCRLTIEQGGDHRFVGFERYCEAILQFFATCSS